MVPLPNPIPTEGLTEMLHRNVLAAKSYQPAPKLMDIRPSILGSGVPILIITCADPRVNPHLIFGFDEKLTSITGIIRNAGGRVFDAMRSIAVLQVAIDCGTIVVLHHTDCGTSHYSGDAVIDEVSTYGPEAAKAVQGMSFPGITVPEESVKEDLTALRGSALVKPGTRIVGYVFDIETGLVTEVK